MVEEKEMKEKEKKKKIIKRNILAKYCTFTIYRHRACWAVCDRREIAWAPGSENNHNVPSISHAVEFQIFFCGFFVHFPPFFLQVKMPIDSSVGHH